MATWTEARPSVPPKIHVLIVDQQRTFGDAVAVRLRAETDLVVTAETQSTESARRVLAGRGTDVILLDAELPGESGVIFCADVTGFARAPRVAMLSAASEAQRIVAAIRAGAVAWIRKDESMDHLLRVIRGVARGETWLPPTELGEVLRLLIHDQDNRRSCDELLAVLTPRELDVLFHLVAGAGRKQVAERLQLSTNTVRTHLENLMAKLGVHSTLELVALTRPSLEALPEIHQLRRSAMSTEDWPAEWGGRARVRYRRRDERALFRMPPLQASDPLSGTSGNPIT
jgi:DNA-binding NarL/FixJ family response regulator